MKKLINYLTSLISVQCSKCKSTNVAQYDDMQHGATHTEQLSINAKTVEKLGMKKLIKNVLNFFNFQVSCPKCGSTEVDTYNDFSVGTMLGELLHVCKKCGDKWYE